MRRLLSLLLLLIVACGGQPTTTTPSEEHASGEALRRMKRPAEHLSELRSAEQYRDYVARYWDDLDFAQGKSIEEYDRDHLYECFATYVMVIPPRDADSLLRHLIHRAEASREVFDLFATMARDVLYDPNAPTRNDEYYLPILEEIVASHLLDPYDKIAPEHELHIVRQNRVGDLANDFEYMLADGTTHRLYDTKADFTILLFNNPGCEMCRTIISDIERSELISDLGKRYSIITLAIYPDEDVEAWRNYLSKMPQGWICGYDAEQRITTERSYDLKAIPSLYLLDGDKRVIVKDGTSAAHLEQALLKATQR